MENSPQHVGLLPCLITSRDKNLPFIITLKFVWPFHLVFHELSILDLDLGSVFQTSLIRIFLFIHLYIYIYCFSSCHILYFNCLTEFWSNLINDWKDIPFWNQGSHSFFLNFNFIHTVKCIVCKWQAYQAFQASLS